MTTTGHYLPVGINAPIPDLHRGACLLPQYRQIAHDAQTELTYGWAEKLRMKAVAVCAICPMLVQCREYVLMAERPAGEWVGVWGGFTPEQRRSIHARH